MALIFLGRISTERFIDENNKPGTRERQSFRAGHMAFKETWIGTEDVFLPKIGDDGKELKDENGGVILEKVGVREVQKEQITSLRPKDIGKSFEHWHNESDVLARYPLAFKKG